MKSQQKISTTIFFAILLMSVGKLQAQQSFVASGTNATGSSGSISYSVGQIFYTAKGSNNQVNEGVQQSYEILTLATNETKSHESSVSLYPNPVSDVLFVDFNQDEFSGSSFKLYDAQGKLIKQGSFSQKKNELNFSMLPTSVYIMQIFREGSAIKSFKIIKK